MSLLDLSRVNKKSRFTIKQEKQNTPIVKQEPLSARIKAEPKSCYDLFLSSVKVEPSFVAKKQEIPIETIKCLSKSILTPEPFDVKKEKSTLWPGHGLKRGRRRKVSSGSPKTRAIDRAIRVHKTLSSKDPDSLTNRELDSLNWAESVIVRHTFRRNLATTDHNRIILCDTPDSESWQLMEEPAPKHAESLEVESLDVHTPLKKITGVVADTMELAVVDFGKPGGRYSFEQGILIIKTLGEAVVNYVLTNVGLISPAYGKPSWHDGVIVLDCKDEQSYNFAKTAVSEMKLWRRALLRAVPPEKAPFMSKGRLYVPNFGIEREQLIDILRSQNPLINMEKWTILEEENVVKNGLKGYTLLMNKPPVALLQNKRIRLFFGAGEVTLKLLEYTWPDEI